ncbi:hypothetical protein C5Y96_06780 [Blastopirellula marina]|uniref:Uncharacterized protein n=1 Tax=Blastopirellula marina TaxID=124 RepID=A0A2S8FYE3_9BACT|nr:hypothetical protein C5Y96_06780 [Blastopirellula marina]RCS53579.1 hypothetical protein DTL36_06790 [Bremerella cremea]
MVDLFVSLLLGERHVRRLTTPLFPPLTTTIPLFQLLWRQMSSTIPTASSIVGMAWARRTIVPIPLRSILKCFTIDHRDLLGRHLIVQNLGLAAVVGNTANHFQHRVTVLRAQMGAADSSHIGCDLAVDDTVPLVDQDQFLAIG